MAFGAYGRDRRPYDSVVLVSLGFYSPLPDAPMIEQSLAAPYGHHLMAKTIIAIMSNGDII